MPTAMFDRPSARRHRPPLPARPLAYLTTSQRAMLVARLTIRTAGAPQRQPRQLRLPF